MKSPMLHAASIFLCLKNELKIFPIMEAHENSGTTLKQLFLKQTTLILKGLVGTMYTILYFRI